MKINFYYNKISGNIYLLLIFLLIGIRCFFNAAVPLLDKTEARYGEIARIMSETKNWLIPHIDYGVPFWAKPPLSSWMTAFSINVFGNSEFFVRLPYLLVSIVMIFLTCRYSSLNKSEKLVPAIILLTIPEFFLHVGVVSTDLFLSFSVAIVFFSFWEYILSSNNKWIFIFFIGLSLGLLSKGPIAIILSLPPIIFWSIRFSIPLNKILTKYLLLGILLFSLITIPWYYLAEKFSPGFIDYFIVGEHFNRFFDSNWSGDKYGFPKSQPIGIIWGFLILFTIPWIIFLITKLFKNINSIWNNKWRLYLIFWLLWTPIFFTLSSSLIHPYILPIMIPFSLLVSEWWNEMKNKKTYLFISLIIPVLLLLIYPLDWSKKILHNNTDKYLIQNIDHNESIFSLNKKSYSSQYYSNGKIKVLNTRELDSIISNKLIFSIIINNDDYEKYPNKEKLTLLKTNDKKGIYNGSGPMY